MTAGGAARAALASAAQSGWRFVQAVSTAYVVYHYGAFVSQVVLHLRMMSKCCWLPSGRGLAAARWQRAPAYAPPSPPPPRRRCPRRPPHPHLCAHSPKQKKVDGPSMFPTFTGRGDLVVAEALPGLAERVAVGALSILIGFGWLVGTIGPVGVCCCARVVFLWLARACFS